MTLRLPEYGIPIAIIWILFLLSGAYAVGKRTAQGYLLRHRNLPYDRFTK